MLKIKPPCYRFCPFCGKKLQVRIEEEKERKYCPSCEWTYYPHVAAAAGAIILRNNKVLLVKRRREPYKDTWMFPAGFVDFGEHPLETATREVAEETGLKIKNARLLNIIQSVDDPRSPGHFVFFYEAPWANAHGIFSALRRSEIPPKQNSSHSSTVLQPWFSAKADKVTVVGSKIKTDKEENTEIAWFDIEKPPKIGWKSHQHMMKSIQKRAKIFV